MKERLPTNMIVLKRSRTRPRAGDLFVCNMRGERWIIARVIQDRCRMMSGNGNEFLVYFYRLEVSDPEQVRPPLQPDLLIAPVIINALPWRVGLFKTIANYPLLAGEMLAHHYFCYVLASKDNPEGVYWDEFRHPSPPPGPTDYVAGAGLSGYAITDIELSRAIGMEPAWDPLAGLQRPQENLAIEGATVIVYVATSEDDPGFGLDEIEEPLAEALEHAGVGKIEGHGFDLIRGYADIRFMGSSPTRVRDTLLPILKTLNLPPGSFMVVGGKRPTRISL